RVRARHRRGRSSCVPLRPRRSRRKHPARTRSVPRRTVPRRRAASRRASGARRLACMTRYLVLAEGFSDNPHYGKTMRGVLRYRRDDVVAIVDSTRAAGDTDDGVPIVQRVEEALALGPDTALVGVATQGGRFPPAWTRLLRECIEHGLDIENGLHVFLV